MNTPVITLFWGAALLILLFAYLGTVAHYRKKILGSILTLGVSAFCLWAYTGLGIKKGIDLGGGSSFTVQLKPGKDADGKVKELSPNSVQQAIAILEKRLNPDGAKDLLLAPQGTDRIMIQMPGVTPEENEEVRQKIEQVAHLEFRLVHPNSDMRLAEMKATGGVEVGYTELKLKPDQRSEGEPESYLVKSRADLEGKHVSSAFAYPDPAQGWVIILNFDSTGAKIFGDLTSQNIGRQLAMIVDDEIISAPNLRTAILGGNAEISGSFTETQARGLASALENPLENPMEIIETSNVSASFGEQTIKQGVQTGIVSSILVALFMLIYYRFAGLIALIGLAVCMLMVFGAMALFNFTLTMPGIAGIVLTIGMAVDANVLIYERLREEMASGKTLRDSLDGAFNKAFSAIFDANITTLISAIILFYLATGLVKGFAVTLTVGIVGTMLGALVVTRVVFNWFIDSGALKKLTVTQIIPEKNYNLLKYSKHFMILSLMLTVISIAVFFVKGSDSIGVDFRGGALTRFEVAAGKEADTEAIEKTLGDAKFSGVSVQKNTSGDLTLISVRSEFEDGDKVKALLQEKFAGTLNSGQTDKIGSVIGKELAIKSTIAYLLAVTAIFIYLVIFYEMSFAVAAIIALIHDCIVAIGLSVVFGQQLSVIHIGALLTIAGYSLNDTIIVFDRIRDMLKTRSGNARDLMNEAISATLSRTLLTSITVLMSMFVLQILGGPSMQEFALPIIIGVLVGTYSSIYIASSLVLWYSKITGRPLRGRVLDSEEVPEVELVTTK